MREKESDLVVCIPIEVVALEREKSREDDSRVCALFLILSFTFDTASYVCADDSGFFYFSSVFLSVVKAVAVSARTHNLTSSTLDRWIFGVKFSFVRCPSRSRSLALRPHCVYRIEYTKTRKTEANTKTIFSCIFVQFLQYLRLSDGVLFSLPLYRYGIK